MTAKIKIIEKQTGDVLKEFEIHESEKAYLYAKEMEDFGLDVKLLSPGASETLIRSLGASDADTLELSNEFDHEIESHHGSCCATLDESEN